jgi:hypothetical protein
VRARKYIRLGTVVFHAAIDDDFAPPYARAREKGWEGKAD